MKGRHPLMCLPVHTVPLWGINPSTSAAPSTNVNRPGRLPWHLRSPRQSMVPQGTHVASAPQSESFSTKQNAAGKSREQQ